MKINICHHNTQGLANDAQILKGILESEEIVENVVVTCYEEVDIIRSNPPKSCESGGTTFEFQFFLEHVFPELLKYGNKNVFIPNVEWMNKKDYHALGNIDFVIAKTTFAHGQLMQFTPEKKLVYWGWISLDRYNASVPKSFDSVLHLKGISRYKQSQTLLNAWIKHPEWPHLQIVSYGSHNINGYIELPKPIKVANNITLYQKKISEKQVEYLLNACGIHMCTSFSEGFGHYIYEGLSTGSCVIVPDCPPMNEYIDNKIPVRTDQIKRVGFGVGNTLTERDIEKYVSQILKTRNLENIGKISRQKFLDLKDDFEKNVKSFINGTNVVT